MKRTNPQLFLCCRPRCNQPGSITYLGEILCDGHYEAIENKRQAEAENMPVRKRNRRK